MKESLTTIRLLTARGTIMLAGIIAGYCLGLYGGKTEERKRIKKEISRVFGIGNESRITENSLGEIGTRTYFLRGEKIEGYATFCPDSILTKIVDGNFTINDLFSNGYIIGYTIDEKDVPSYITARLKGDEK